MNQSGSTWNKWDLHIHTNASDGKSSCEEIVQAAVKNEIKCIAITDHHTFENIDVMKKLGKAQGISVISGIEFRTEYGQKSVHLIGLFPDTYEDIVLDKIFLTENVLNQLGISRSKIIRLGRENEPQGLTEDYYFKKGMFKTQVNFKEAANLIHRYGGLVTVHAGKKSNGIETEMLHERKNRNISIEESLSNLKEELFKEGYIDICELPKKDLNQATFYQSNFNRPSITCSDAHSAEHVGDNACWIKADTNFYGLKQILCEPERISFSEPEILERLRNHPDKFIRKIEINRTVAATMPEIWFKDIQIPLNPGLVAIVGSKGNGKSAITDIISLCGDTSNENWSFLTPAKFRMPQPFNRSKQIEARLEWEDGSFSDKKTLDLPSDKNKPERVKYIPQNFLEQLCVTEKSRDFEQELKEIIFKYLKPEERFNHEDLDSLIDYLTTENKKTNQILKNEISSLNEEIIKLETKKQPDYLEKLNNELTLKRKQKEYECSNPPKEISDTQEKDSDKTKNLRIKITSLQNSCTNLQSEIRKLEAKKVDLLTSIKKLINSEESLGRYYSLLISERNKVSTVFQENGLDINSIISVQYNPEIIRSKVRELRNAISAIDTDLISIKNSLTSEQQTIENEKKSLTKSQQEYQNYLNNRNAWENRIRELEGSKDLPGTIEYLQYQIDYIKNKLTQDLNEKISQRKALLEKLILNKKEILKIYNDLYSPIVNFIDKYKNQLSDYPIEFNSTFTIENFGEKFFDFINQQVSGSYYGKEQGAIRIQNTIEKVDMTKLESIANFPYEINLSLFSDLREEKSNPKIIETQLKKGHTKLELYNFLYEMDYLKPEFQLKMNGKHLSSLSPGERGALLLLLYLFIDNDDKPLIIDQPEENLDNESVYKYLVRFIKEAKKKRQIIMVTHNPNLAVVCDADQIIQMKIDKENANEVSFQAGAIENPKINKILIDILEGTYPAFHNRDSKYFAKS